MSIYCIGRNYVAHAHELGNDVPDEPLVFLKAAASQRGLEPTPVAFPEESFHHEVELVLRVGRPVPLGEPGSWDHVDAVTLGLDLTRREVQSVCKERGKPWTISKSFAGSAILAPFVPHDELGAPPYRFTLHVNDALVQSGDTSLMIFDVPTLLTYLAHLAPLNVGDLVFTGTPAGVGPLRVGDRFVLALEDDHGHAHTWRGML